MKQCEPLFEAISKTSTNHLISNMGLRDASASKNEEGEMDGEDETSSNMTFMKTFSPVVFVTPVVLVEVLNVVVDQNWTFNPGNRIRWHTSFFIIQNLCHLSYLSMESLTHGNVLVSSLSISRSFSHRSPTSHSV